MLDENGSGYSYTGSVDNPIYDPTVGFHINAPAAGIVTVYPNSKTWYLEVKELFVGRSYPGDFKTPF